MTTVLDHLGLSLDDFTRPEPEEWTAETLDAWQRQYRAVAGAQLWLLGGNSSLEHGKNVVLLPTADVLVDHVEWQISRLTVTRLPGLFSQLASALVSLDGPSPVEREPDLRQLENGWPAHQAIEVVNTTGKSLRLPTDAGEGDLAAVLAEIMAAVDEAVANATPFHAFGPTPAVEHTVPLMFEQLLRCALLETALRGESEHAALIAHVRACRQEPIREAALEFRTAENRYDRFRAAVLLAAIGDERGAELLAEPWPPTNSGIEIAEGCAALFLLGIEPSGDDPFSWHAAPGQPGARLRHLVHLTRNARERSASDLAVIRST